MTQEALRSALRAERIDAWLDEVASLPPAQIDRDVVTAAVDAAKDELEGGVAKRLVVDASAMVNFLVGSRLRAIVHKRLSGHELHAPLTWTPRFSRGLAAAAPDAELLHFNA